MTPRAAEDRFFAKLKRDVAMWEVAWQKKASAGMVVRLLLFEGGFQFVTLLRIVEASDRVPLIGAFLSLTLQYWTNRFFACDMARRVTIGGGLFVPHPTGIVVGADVIIGRDVSLLHQVTIGRIRPDTHTAPRIGDGAYLSPGVKIMGDITIGENAMIGANSVVLNDIPPHTVAVGSPARIVKRKERLSVI